LADAANLEYAKRQTELALEHLRDQVQKDNSDLLQKLGWTKDDARQFLERWESMKRAAGSERANSAAKRRFENAIRNLGLQHRGVELKRGDVPLDQPDRQRSAARFAPPPDWQQQYEAFKRGVAGENRSEKGDGK
jgi:hypothetical protein